jgi:hypothetical protein
MFFGRSNMVVSGRIVWNVFCLPGGFGELLSNASNMCLPTLDVGHLLHKVLFAGSLISALGSAMLEFTL